MGVKDRTKIWERYKGLWVALKGKEETVVGSGKTLKEAVAEAEKNGCTDPLVTRMPERLITFAGTAL